jgi:hypothetical protein
MTFLVNNAIKRSQQAAAKYSSLDRYIRDELGNRLLCDYRSISLLNGGCFGYLPWATEAKCLPGRCRVR